MELIPFDINADFEKWDVVTRDGRKVLEWHQFKTDKLLYQICAIIRIGNDRIENAWYTLNGNYLENKALDSYDLFLTPKVKKMYTNIYNDISGGFRGSIKECIENKGTECLGTIEVSIHDNKLIDVKIVEG